MISGGSDSLLVVWRDVTEENRLKTTAEHEKLILEEQKLSNLLKSNELADALKLALKLERPYQVIKIVDAIMKEGKDHLIDAIRELKPNRKDALLRCAVTWNTNSRNSHAAQVNLCPANVKSKQNHADFPRHVPKYQTSFFHNEESVKSLASKETSWKKST